MRTADDTADIVIITGLSGAGRSTAAKSLEDLGWFVVDNLPPGLLPTMVDLAARSNGAVSRMAAVVDVRSRAFSTDLKSAISDLGARGATARVVYLEAAEDTLVRRFDSERRPHPLQGTGRVTDGIAAERELLREARGEADLVVDTSRLNVHQLRARMRNVFGGGRCHQSAHLRLRIAHHLNQGSDVFGADEGFVALDIDVNIGCLSNGDFVHALGSAAMRPRGH